MNVIIMAGGSGTRFWPMSRSRYPKQFLEVIGSRPLIEETYLRIASLVEEQRTYVIVHEDHTEMTRKIFSGTEVKVIVEPLAKNTAPCIALGLIHILEEHGNGPVVVLPADHYVGDISGFQNTIKTAVKLVKDGGGIGTIGIVPTRPETGYGYIKAGELLSEDIQAFRVEAFMEKPSLAKARQFLANGGYYWNSGIFVFMAETMMEEMGRCLPDLRGRIEPLRGCLGMEDYQHTLRQAYQNITPISIDYGVMEKTTADVFVLPGWFPWSDVGSWQAVFEMRHDERDEEGNIVDGDAIVLDCKHTFVQSRSDRLIGCIGLRDIFIVDTPDALLVCHRTASQDVRRFVDIIKDRGLDNLL